jgi:uncharacterized iron-regulated membrane protein
LHTQTYPKGERQRRRARSFWLTAHLYLGLSAGLLFALVGLTGSVNVFFWDLDELLNPNLVVHEISGDPLPLDAIVERVRQANPGRTGAWSLSLPRHAHGMITANYQKPEETADRPYAPLMVSVNPYTGEIVANRFWGDTLFTWIYNLHYTLLLGRLGEQIVGIAGLVLLVSLASGIYLWWPSPGKLSMALTVKRQTSAQRLVYDLHRVLGIYGAIVLIVVALSGVYLVFPDYVIALLQPVSPGLDNPYAAMGGNDAKSIPNGRPPITIAQALAAADRALPGTELKLIDLPGDATDAYTVFKRYPGEANVNFPMNAVAIDQYSGAVLSLQDTAQFSAAKTFLDIQFPLHSGEALGLFGRILVCLSGFLPTALLATGFIRWRHKRRAAHRVERRRIAAGIQIAA